MIKKYLLKIVFVLGLILGLASFQLALATADLSFTADTNVLIGSDTYVITSGSTATSVVADTSTVTVVVPAASTLIFTSPDKFVLNNNGSITETCTTISTLTIVGPKTVIITPDNSHTCTGAVAPVHHEAASGGSSGSAISHPVFPTAPSSQGCLPGDKFSSATGLPCPTSGVTNTTTFTTQPPMSPASCTITVTLRQGNKGTEVKCLQTILLISADGIFGPHTKASVIVFQKSKGLVGDGIVGPKTRAALLLQ